MKKCRLILPVLLILGAVLLMSGPDVYRVGRLFFFLGQGPAFLRASADAAPMGREDGFIPGPSGWIPTGN